MTPLTPEDIAMRFRVTIRRAFKWMRAAGAIADGDSLRITEERFSEWLKNEMASTSAGASGGSARTPSQAKRGRRTAATSRPLASTERSANASPPIRPTQPRKRRASTNGSAA